MMPKPDSIEGRLFELYKMLGPKYIKAALVMQWMVLLPCMLIPLMVGFVIGAS